MMLFPKDVRIPISRTAGVLTARARETAGVAAFMGGAPFSVHQEPLQATAGTGSSLKEEGDSS